MEDLKRHLSDAEREKRDLIGVISRLKQESSQREGNSSQVFFYAVSLIHGVAVEEVQTLRASLREARQDHQALEAQVRELRSAETSTKVSRSFLQWTLIIHHPTVQD
jgi:nucleoprotein TPR